MADWSMEDLAREIERRRGSARRRTAAKEADEETEKALKEIQDWSDEDWAEAFTRRHGCKASPWGTEQVKGGSVWRGDVRVFRLEGQAHPWQGFAWAVLTGASFEFRSAVRAGAIQSAADAVRAV